MVDAGGMLPGYGARGCIVAGGGMLDEGAGIVAGAGMVDVLGMVLTGTGVTVSRMAPPPITLPSMVVLPVPSTRCSQAMRSAGGCLSQRASAFWR